MNGGNGFVVVASAVELRHAHAAQAKGEDFKTAASKLAKFHDSPLRIMILRPRPAALLNRCLGRRLWLRHFVSLRARLRIFFLYIHLWSLTFRLGCFDWRNP